MLYMLDTNICSFIIRNKPQNIKNKLEEVERDHTIAISSIVASELFYGAVKKNSPNLIRVVSALIDNFIVYDYSKICVESYAVIRSNLEKNGTIIGANDLLIASHAMSVDAILVTNNTKEFSRVEGLRVEDWSVC